MKGWDLLFFVSFIRKEEVSVFFKVGLREVFCLERKGFR